MCFQFFSGWETCFGLKSALKITWHQNVRRPISFLYKLQQLLVQKMANVAFGYELFDGNGNDVPRQWQQMSVLGQRPFQYNCHSFDSDLSTQEMVQVVRFLIIISIALKCSYM